jgi:Bacterial regulatory proteins, lacI family
MVRDKREDRKRLQHFMPVTIKDVARESGVNTPTVSRAPNNAYGVNDKTRKHGMEVATRLNYRTNQVARGLVTGRSHTIGLVVSDIQTILHRAFLRAGVDASLVVFEGLNRCFWYDTPKYREIDGLCGSAAAGREMPVRPAGAAGAD